VEAGSSPTVEAAGPLPPVTSAAPPIDYDMLGQILGNTEPDFVRSMLSLFRESYTSLKARMSAAIGARDAAALRDAAHAAKGAAGNACATRLRAVLDSLESGAAAGDWSAVSGHWDELTAEDRVVLEHISSL
jgi:HPt (histidine-containing phosphotransfer) domain-containing protein